MFNKIRTAVLAFLLALVMVIGLIPFAATEVQAVTIPVGDITTNDSFDTGGEWEDGDELYLCRASKENQWAKYTLTANVADGATTWTPSEKLYWDGKDEQKLILNYPANLGLGWNDFAIPSDQSTLEALKSADCMNARWAGDPTTEPVNFELKHRMSMVTVTYTLASEFESDIEITPEVYSNAKYIIFIDSDNLPMNTSVDQYDTWVKAYKHNEVDGEGNVTARKFTAIVSPDAYSAGDDFIRITIGNQVLTAKMKEDITFEEGTHYTFDLKVGKDKVTIKRVSVSGTDYPFGEGWNNEEELDDGSGSITDTQDEGKTAWEDGDQIIATLTSQRYGEQTATLTYDGANWTHPEDMTFKYLENETPTVKAVYAPSNELGTGEYIEFDCELNGEELTVKLESATRNYSRLRIIGLPNQELPVFTTDFCPAGATVEKGSYIYNLTADEKGNAYLYGTFAAMGTVLVKTNDDGSVSHIFESATEYGKSYVLDAHTHTYKEDGSCSICGKRAVVTITFDTDGGSEVAPITQECGTAVIAPANPTRNGYNFIGWSPALPTTMPTEDITVKALWQAIGHNIVWKDWDGTVLKTDYNVANGTIPTYKGTPQRETDDQYVYKFIGWSPAVAAVTGDAIYTATFEAIPLSECTYQIGDKVTASDVMISYCSKCGSLLKNYTATITGVRNIVGDGTVIYWVTLDCCGHKTSLAETTISGLA